MTEEEFYDSDFRRFFNRLNGHFEAEQRRERGEWERTRWQSATFLQAFVKKGHKIKLQDLAVFPWEEDETKVQRPKGRKLTPEEVRAKFAEADKKRRQRWQAAKVG